MLLGFPDIDPTQAAQIDVTANDLPPSAYGLPIRIPDPQSAATENSPIKGKAELLTGALNFNSSCPDELDSKCILLEKVQSDARFPENLKPT
jgi:hypothetical protein